MGRSLAAVRKAKDSFEWKAATIRRVTLAYKARRSEQLLEQGAHPKYTSAWASLLAWLAPPVAHRTELSRHQRAAPR